MWMRVEVIERGRRGGVMVLWMWCLGHCEMLDWGGLGWVGWKGVGGCGVTLDYLYQGFFVMKGVGGLVYCSFDEN